MMKGGIPAWIRIRRLSAIAASPVLPRPLLQHLFSSTASAIDLAPPLYFFVFCHSECLLGISDYLDQSAGGVLLECLCQSVRLCPILPDTANPRRIGQYYSVSVKKSKDFDVVIMQ